MRAVLPFDPASPAAPPRLGDWPEPTPGPGEVLLEVRGTALNRADLLQLAGGYPPPPGVTPVPGLEAAGEIVAVGPDADPWRVGDRAMALLAGGGHAERVVAPVGQLLPIPHGWSWAEAGATPEAAITAWTNLVVEGKLRTGQTVLVSGATSGVGSYLVALARALGARPLAAARDRARLAELAPVVVAEDAFELGPDLAERVRGAVPGGVDLVLDLVGGDHLPPLVACLAPRGRLVLVGLMAGRSAGLDLGLVLSRRLTLVGSVLRPRSLAEKRDLVAGFAAFAAGRPGDLLLRPRIAREFPLAELPAAYDFFAHGRPLGKVAVVR